MELIPDFVQQYIIIVRKLYMYCSLLRTCICLYVSREVLAQMIVSVVSCSEVAVPRFRRNLLPPTQGRGT
jgi:hypothetical protein